jgi:hypothetical protein
MAASATGLQLLTKVTISMQGLISCAKGLQSRSKTVEMAASATGLQLLTKVTVSMLGLLGKI